MGITEMDCMAWRQFIPRNCAKGSGGEVRREVVGQQVTLLVARALSSVRDGHDSSQENGEPKSQRDDRESRWRGPVESRGEVEDPVLWCIDVDTIAVA